MTALAKAIYKYESDTFSASASEITPDEAEAMAVRYLKLLVDVVAEGGSLRFDGTIHSTELERIRGRRRSVQRPPARASRK